MVVIGGFLQTGKYSNDIFTFDFEFQDWGHLPVKQDALAFAQGAVCTVQRAAYLNPKAPIKEEAEVRQVSNFGLLTIGKSSQTNSWKASIASEAGTRQVWSVIGFSI